MDDQHATRVQAAFTDWAMAELASHYVQPCPDEVMNKLVDTIYQSAEKLAAIPAETADDLLLKLFPILLANCEAAQDEPPMVPDPKRGEGSEGLIASVIDDLRRISPQIAHVMAAPHFSVERRNA